MRLFAPRPVPAPVRSPLEHKILAEFALFRRPARARDRPPPASLFRGSLGRTLAKEYEMSRYYPAYIRQAIVSRGSRYFVVPGFERQEAVPPARCFGPGQRRQLVEQQRRRRTEPVYCVLRVGAAPRVSGLGCEPFVAVREGGGEFDSMPDVRHALIELAPDGVASVRVSYRNRKPIRLPVRENAFRLFPPREGDLEATPTKVKWLGATGRLIRVIRVPAPDDRNTSLGSARAPIGG